MIHIRFHGRSGQSVITSAELTALAAITQGKYAEASPSLRVERRGAPVTAHVRVSDTPIRTRDEIKFSDVVVVLDPTLLSMPDITAGLAPNGLVIVNTRKSAAKIRQETGIDARLAVVDAGETGLEVSCIPVDDTVILETLIIASPIPATEMACSCLENYLTDSGRHAEKPFPMEELLSDEMGPVIWKELEPGTAAVLWTN